MTALLDLPITVGTNSPKRAQPAANGATAGAPVQGPAPAPAVVSADPTAGRYWTRDKAQHAVAYACKALEPIAGPKMRATDFELEMVGDPLAAVLHEIWPLPSSESAPLQVNLMILLVVVAVMALVRLPEILAAVEKMRAKKRPDPDAPAARVEPAPAPAAKKPEHGWEAPRAVGDGRLGQA